MISFTVSEMANQIDAVSYSGNASFSSVSTDSRTITKGALFVALNGPNFNGHEFAAVAEKQNAAGLMISEDIDSALPHLRVRDTRQGLGAMAKAWRIKSGAPLIAITGSNGKTTVKEMIASILSQVDSVLSTAGNLNNEIGVPLTLLRLQDEKYAVVEMGASGPDEIAYLTKMAQPNVAVLNNACRSHLEGFGSLEGVAKAKGEIALGLGDQGTFIYNADDMWADYWRTLWDESKTITFGVSEQAQVSSSKDSYQLLWNKSGLQSQFQVSTPKGNVEIQLSLAGEHNRLNALAAIAATLSLGTELPQIKKGLAAMRPVKGRLYPKRSISGALIIDDSYNANPDSVSAAIKVLAQAPGRRILVLGALAELGEDTVKFYQEIGELAQAEKIDLLCTLGDAKTISTNFGEAAVHFTNADELVAFLKSEITASDVVLIKGSRSAAMENIINPLTKREDS